MYLSGDPVKIDSATGLTWQSGSAGNVTWQAALAFCENLVWAGYEDWRLPNVAELDSTVDVSTPATQNSWLWSSSTYASDPGNAWRISGVGYVNAGNLYKKTDVFNARCVRLGL